MQKYLFPALIGAVVLIVAGVVLTRDSDTYEMPEPSPSATTTPATDMSAPVSETTTSETTTTTTTSGGYTSADVATHNSAQSCWTIISGSVYDLTAWVAAHPGGSRAILGICGKDGTAAFSGQHGGDARPEQTLAQFKIGVLAQ